VLYLYQQPDYKSHLLFYFLGRFSFSWSISNNQSSNTNKLQRKN